MVKKLILAACAVVALVYGTGHDFSDIKRSLLGAADQNARGLTGSDDDGWGDTY